MEEKIKISWWAKWKHPQNLNCIIENEQRFIPLLLNIYLFVCLSYFLTTHLPFSYEIGMLLYKEELSSGVYTPIPLRLFSQQYQVTWVSNCSWLFHHTSFAATSFSLVNQKLNTVQILNFLLSTCWLNTCKHHDTYIKYTFQNVKYLLTGDSMSSRSNTKQRSHLSRVWARCIIFFTIFSRSVCSSKRSLTTSSKAFTHGMEINHNWFPKVMNKWLGNISKKKELWKESVTNTLEYWLLAN